MERLSKAQESRHLGEAFDGYGDVDWLRASGMVAQQHELALALWRLIERGEASALAPSFDGMMRVCVSLGQLSNPAHTCSAVLGWMMNPRCTVCGGRGHPVIPGTPKLADEPCPACSGKGRRTPEWGEQEMQLYVRVRRMQVEAARALARKLKG